MAKVEIRTHINCNEIYDNNDEFKEVEKFFEELTNGNSESRINHQLSVWDNYNTYPQYPNLRREFTLDGIEEIYVHHKVWNHKRNYISIKTSRFNLHIYLTDKQMEKVSKLIKNLNVNVRTNNENY